jgi:hypothetical protein
VSSDQWEEAETEEEEEEEIRNRGWEMKRKCGGEEGG